ncbi:MAG: cytochrome c [Bacteroidia bacterium]
MHMPATTYRHLGVLTICAILLSGCYYDKSKRNIEYSPNMYNSLPLEPYSQTVYAADYGGNFAAVEKGLDKVRYFADGLSAQRAPEGTVPRAESWYVQEAYQPYPYPNTTEGYDLATQNYKSPLNQAATNEKGYSCNNASFQRGKKLYAIHCTMCHGANGDGQGNLVTAGVYAGVPSYASRAYLTEGQMYHSITYGKGIMGSYASALTPKERWEVICYINEWVKQGQAAAAPVQ